jgi:hypothetical protein
MCSKKEVKNMTKEYPEKITFYITAEQKEWVQARPRSYNLSEKMRGYLEVLINETK